LQLDTSILINSLFKEKRDELQKRLIEVISAGWTKSTAKNEAIRTRLPFS